MKERFIIERSGSSRKPWKVIDTSGDPCEDPILYMFSSRRKANEFKKMLEDEPK